MLPRSLVRHEKQLPESTHAEAPRNSISTLYYQECPACARLLSVAVAYLGKRVSCRHCSARFLASDPASASAPGDRQPSSLERAEALLRRVADDTAMRETHAENL